MPSNSARRKRRKAVNPKVNTMQTLREKVAKTIKFTPSGWIILNEWVNEGKPNEYLNSIKFDDKDYALDWLLGEPGRYTVDNSCKV